MKLKSEVKDICLPLLERELHGNKREHCHLAQNRVFIYRIYV